MRYQTLPCCLFARYICHCLPRLPLKHLFLLAGYTSAGSTMYILISRFFIVLKSDCHQVHLCTPRSLVHRLIIARLKLFPRIVCRWILIWYICVFLYTIDIGIPLNLYNYYVKNFQGKLLVEIEDAIWQ